MYPPNLFHGDAFDVRIYIRTCFEKFLVGGPFTKRGHHEYLSEVPRFVGV